MKIKFYKNKDRESYRRNFYDYFLVLYLSVIVKDEYISSYCIIICSLILFNFTSSKFAFIEAFKINNYKVYNFILFFIILILYSCLYVNNIYFPRVSFYFIILYFISLIRIKKKISNVPPRWCEQK